MRLHFISCQLQHYIMQPPRMFDSRLYYLGNILVYISRHIHQDKVHLWKNVMGKINICSIHSSYNRRFFRFIPRTDFAINVINSNKCYSCLSGDVNKRLISYTEHNYKTKDNKETNCSGSEDVETDDEYEKLSRQWLHISHIGQQLLVIQPYIKWGTGKKYNTTPELQLAETIALVQSLPKWTVVDKMIIPLKSFEKKTYFGHGNFEMLKERIRKDKRITAVFISTNVLRSSQHRTLEDAFRVTVYDRYTVVMQIFRERAKTKEAKLQVALAEIPYLRSQLKRMDKQSRGALVMEGTGEMFLEAQKRLLARRENKIHQTLERLRGHRELLRNKRSKQEYPIVAVIGYTNAGKTSLIQMLTGDLTMQPEDKLFATLDVTMHIGVLPSHLKVLYVDTIGFISDIPTNLIESFKVALEDVMLADVILHVRDVSHPDTEAQAENVLAILKSLNLSPKLMHDMVVAGNKVDLVEKAMQMSSEDWIPVSAINSTGLSKLKNKIEEAVLASTGRTSIVIRVPMGSTEASWLYKEAAVSDARADPKNSQYLLMRVVISHAQLKKFQHYFIK